MLPVRIALRRSGDGVVVAIDEGSEYEEGGDDASGDEESGVGGVSGDVGENELEDFEE